MPCAQAVFNPFLAWHLGTRRIRYGALLMGCFLLTHVSLSAQLSRNCGTMGHLEELIKSHPATQMNMRSINNHLLRVSKGSSAGRVGAINIPVVVHVVYHNPEQNISDEQVLSQMRVINQDFQRKNPDKDQTPAAFQDVAANTQIQFSLAARDPSGNATNGITRTYSPKTVFYTNQNDVKRRATGGVDAWPADQYLNIWVCPLANGVLGYAQFPGGPTDTDGVVINYKAFGTLGTVSAPFNQGRTATHEIGHWLNLKHIWGDKYGACDEDDEVIDTPPTSDPHYGCVRTASSCDTEDMPSNFMDYTDDACMNLFTFGQAERMRALFAPGGFRSSLLNSPALQPLAPTPPPIPVVMAPPSEVTFSALSENGVRIDWPAIADAAGYRIKLRRTGTDQWLERRFNRTYINAVKLKSCTEYEIKFATYYGEELSDYSENYYFTTKGCRTIPKEVEVKQAPDAFAVKSISPTEAAVSWTEIPAATSYKLQFKVAGEHRVHSREFAHNEGIISNLRPGQRYLFRIRGNYGAEAGPYSKVGQFQTTSSAMAASRIAMPSSTSQIKAVLDPSSDQVRIYIPTKEKEYVQVKVLDALNRVVYPQRGHTIIPRQALVLTAKDWGSGTFKLQVTDEEGFVQEVLINK